MAQDSLEDFTKQIEDKCKESLNAYLRSVELNPSGENRSRVRYVNKLLHGEILGEPSVFLSYRFKHTDLYDRCIEVFHNSGIQVITAEADAGDPIYGKIREEMGKCHFFFGILTFDDELPLPPWAMVEYGMAVMLLRRHDRIAFVRQPEINLGFLPPQLRTMGVPPFSNLKQFEDALKPVAKRFKESWDNRMSRGVSID
jgi:hypothetical protein